MRGCRSGQTRQGPDGIRSGRIGLVPTRVRIPSPAFMKKALKEVIDEICRVIERDRDVLVIAEGKNDKRALESVGFRKVMILTKPLYEVVEEINERKVLILTDLDKKGKQIYSKLKKCLNHKGVCVDDKLRNLLFQTELRQIEGLSRYLDKFLYKNHLCFYKEEEKAIKKENPLMNC